VAGYYRQVTDLLTEHGWKFHRAGKGSHEIWWNPATGEKQSVPSNLTKRHTANGILKDAGIEKKL